ncbi:MAG: hypothetical protein ACK5OB_07365 [Pirellula sp.]
MLYQLPVDTSNYVWKTNCLHWIAYVAFAIATGKCWQWITSVGIWRSVTLTSPTSFDTPPKRLSLRHLVVMTCAVAIAIISYQAWMRSILPPPQPADSLRATSGFYPFLSTSKPWYQWFPLASHTWVSGAIAGCLVPLHAFMIASILRLRGFRILALVAWVMVAFLIRVLSDQVYWEPNSKNDPFLSRLVWVLSVRIPAPNDAPNSNSEPEYRFVKYVPPKRSRAGAKAPNNTHWAMMNSVDAREFAKRWLPNVWAASIQTALLTASILWLATNGYSIQTYRRNLVHAEDPSDAPSDAMNA